MKERRARIARPRGARYLPALAVIGLALSACTSWDRLCGPFGLTGGVWYGNDVPGPLGNALCDALLRSVDEQQVPGLQVSIALPGGGVWHCAVGTADPQRTTALRTDDRMRMASITKVFTAVAILRLVEQGLLSLDDRVAEWLPALPNAGGITIRSLLNHSSGVGDHDGALGCRMRATLCPTTLWTPAELVDMAASSPAYFAGGSNHRYSNTGYVLLGRVAERASGQTMAALVRGLILEPAGLRDTFWAPTEPVIGNLVAGYDDHFIPFPPGVHVIGPENTAWASLWDSAGNIVSTASDVLAFLDSLFGGVLLSAPMLREMTEFSESVPPGVHGFGLGLQRWVVGGDVLWGHTGNFIGFYGMALHCPSRDYTIVLVGNKTVFDRVSVFEDLQTVLNAW